MSTNLQTAQPALVLFLPVYHCYAELTAEIQKPCLGTRDGDSCLRRAEQARGLASYGCSSDVAGYALVQGENTGLSHDIDAL